MTTPIALVTFTMDSGDTVTIMLPSKPLAQEPAMGRIHVSGQTPDNLALTRNVSPLLRDEGDRIVRPQDCDNVEVPRRIVFDIASRALSTFRVIGFFTKANHPVDLEAGLAFEGPWGSRLDAEMLRIDKEAENRVAIEKATERNRRCVKCGSRVGGLHGDQCR